MCPNLPSRGPRSKEAARSCKAKTGVGCDGFHPKVPLSVTRETRGEVVEFVEKVERRLAQRCSS